MIVFQLIGDSLMHQSKKCHKGRGDRRVNRKCEVDV